VLPRIWYVVVAMRQARVGRNNHPVNSATSICVVQILPGIEDDVHFAHPDIYVHR